MECLAVAINFSQLTILVSLESETKSAPCTAAHIEGVGAAGCLFDDVVLSGNGTVIEDVTLLLLIDQIVHFIHNFLLQTSCTLTTPGRNLALNHGRDCLAV